MALFIYNAKMKKHKFISIFSGCGGFDQGFIDNGYDCVAAFDIDKLVIEVHKNNLQSPAHIHDLSLGTLPNIALPEIDLLLAGPPCQGFSTVGKRQLNDPRNKLLTVTGKIVEQLMPATVLVENVTGVVSGKHKQYWDTLHEKLRNLGYQTTDIKCKGTDMGVAQMRTRMVMLGWKNGKQIEINLPLLPGGVLKDAIGYINGAANHEKIFLHKDSPLLKVAKNILPGQKLSNVRGGHRAIHTWNIPEAFGKTSKREKKILETIMKLRRKRRVRDYGDADPVPENLLRELFSDAVIADLSKLQTKGYIRATEGHYDLAETFNGKFRRLDWNEPSLTVDTRFGDPKYFLHPDEDRGFTVREAARIQGFPDSFIFHGSLKEQYRMVGNAVPPPLASCLAKFINNVLLN